MLRQYVRPYTQLVHTLWCWLEHEMLLKIGCLGAKAEPIVSIMPSCSVKLISSPRSNTRVRLSQPEPDS